MDELLLRRQFHSGPRETGAGGAFDSGARLRDSIAQARSKGLDFGCARKASNAWPPAADLHISDLFPRISNEDLFPATQTADPTGSLRTCNSQRTIRRLYFAGML